MLGDVARLRHLRATLAGADPEGSDLKMRLALRMADIMLARGTVSHDLNRDLVERILALLAQWQPPHALASLHATALHCAHEALQETSHVQIKPLLAALGPLQMAIVTEGSPEAKGVLRTLLDCEGERFAAMMAASRAGTGDDDAAEEVAPTADFDADGITRFLRTVHPEEAAVVVSRWKTFTSGLSKTTMLLELDNCTSLPFSIVLRKDSDAVHSAGSVKNEFRLLEALFNQHVKVPQPLACDMEGTTLGAPFITMTKQEGSTIGDLLRLSPKDHGLCVDIARQLARVHSLSADEVGSALPGPLYPSVTDWVAQMIEDDYRGWTELGIVDPIYETAYAWLRANVAVNDAVPRVLVHGDFGLQNILVDQGEVSAILDWEFATLGCGAYDMGYFYDQAEALGSWDEFCDAYASEAGAMPDRKLLNYHILLSAARFGAMGHRMHRHLDTVRRLDDQSAGIACAFFIEEFGVRVARAIRRALD